MRKNFEQTDARTNEDLECSSRFMGLARLFGIMCLFAQLHSPIQAAQTVTLAWDPSSDSTVVGYNLYSGVTSSTYTNKVDVGNTSYSNISGLGEGTTYFFAVTAYDALGLESDFSNELRFTVPGGQLTLSIHAMTGPQFVVHLTGLIGHTYDMEATEDFTAWKVIGTVTLGASGSADFIDINAMSFPKRFYRTLQKP